MAKKSTSDKNGPDEESSPKLELLLTTAADLMARAGYQKTSIRDVASETGLSLAGMYYYFQSKEDLLYKIQYRTFSSLLEELEAVVSEGEDAEERLRRFVQNHLSYYTSHFNEMKICTFELQSLKDERYRDIEKIRRRYFKIAVEIVKEILDADGDRADSGDEARHYTLFIFGMLNWIFMWFDPKRDAPVEDLGEKLVHLALHGLRGHES